MYFVLIAFLFFSGFFFCCFFIFIFILFFALIWFVLLILLYIRQYTLIGRWYIFIYVCSQSHKQSVLPNREGDKSEHVFLRRETQSRVLLGRESQS
jgi:hypothetical protein